MVLSAKEYDFGGAIRSAIESRGLQKSFIASKIGVSPPRLTKILDSRDLKLSTALQVCDAIGCKLDEIIKRGSR